MREVKCLSSAAASARPGRTGSQLCLERPRKTKGVKHQGWRVGCPGDAESKREDLEPESCQAKERSTLPLGRCNRN